MTTILGGCALYLLVCLIAVVSGYGLLSLLRIERTDGALFLAPVVSFVFWSLALGVAVGLCIPLRQVAYGLWGLTLVLALIGLVYRPFGRTPISVLLLCAGLPILIMGYYFIGGLFDTVSISYDGWSYIAFGQYIWEYPRGAQGGLAPLYQYSAHLAAITRFISPALLAFFSVLIHPGDTQIPSSLFQAWLVFTLACSVAFFWHAIKTPRNIFAPALVLSIAAGWMANLVQTNNFDNQLAIIFMPTFAGVFYSFTPTHKRWWVLIGACVAALIYAYIELAAIILAGVLVLISPLIWTARKDWRVWLTGMGWACLIAMIFLLPIATALPQHLLSQLREAQVAGNRPGEGAFVGMLEPQFFLSAFWALGGEYRFATYNLWLNLLGAFFSLLAILGIIVQLKTPRWGISLTSILFFGGIVYYVGVQKYPYAAYKLLTAGWWLFALALIIGAQYMLARLGHRWKASVPIGLWLLAIIVTSNALARNIFWRANYINLVPYRQVTQVREITNQRPIQIWVDDAIANEWAVYYLRDTPTVIAEYRLYMAQAHVIPFMEKSTALDPATIRYLLTDAQFGKRVNQSEWQKRWSNTPYILWEKIVKE